MFLGKSGTIKVFRGLAIPPKAIEFYRKKIQTGEKFEFNGFTSTSLELSVAKKFARLGATGGKVPIILEMTLLDIKGIHNKAYLHNAEYTTFTNEKEILLGCVLWKVEDISEKDDFTVIKLRDVGLGFS